MSTAASGSGGDRAVAGGSVYILSPFRRGFVPLDPFRSARAVPIPLPPPRATAPLERPSAGSCSSGPSARAPAPRPRGSCSSRTVERSTGSCPFRRVPRPGGVFVRPLEVHRARVPRRPHPRRRRRRPRRRGAPPEPHRATLDRQVLDTIRFAVVTSTAARSDHLLKFAARFPAIRIREQAKRCLRQLRRRAMALRSLRARESSATQEDVFRRSRSDGTMTAKSFSR